MSESDKRNIYQRINSVMTDIGAFSKDGRNQHFNYRYASIESIVAAIQPALTEHGIALIFDTLECVQVPVKQYTAKGTNENEVTRVTIKMTAVNIDNPTDIATIHTYGYGVDSQDKGVYKAISGGRKYAMFAMFNLMAGSDDPEHDKSIGDIEL